MDSNDLLSSALSLGIGFIIATVLWYIILCVGNFESIHVIENKNCLIYDKEMYCKEE